MGKIYFIKTSYHPNDAPTNRFLSFIEGFSQLGVDIDVVFVLSDSKGSRIEKQWPHVNITYLWDKLNWKNRYLRQLLYSILTRRFVQRLNSGDTVVLFDVQRMVFPLIRKEGVRVYCERTEHPLAYKMRTVNINKFVEHSRKLDGLFVISTALRDYFEKAGVPKEKVHIINMTVNPQRFEGLRKEPVESPYIAYCGSASNTKDGVDELIKAFAIVARKYPHYKLYIIGKGITKADDASHLKLLEDLHLEKNLVLTGIVPAEEMPQLLKNAEILALDRPDNLQAKYGFPTKLGEYLLTANPVVVTSVGDIPLFLKDGENALLAEPNNTTMFAEKLIWTIEHPIEARVIGRNGAQVARQEFNAYVEAKKMAQILGCI